MTDKKWIVSRIVLVTLVLLESSVTGGGARVDACRIPSLIPLAIILSCFEEPDSNRRPLVPHDFNLSMELLHKSIHQIQTQ